MVTLNTGARAEIKRVADKQPSGDHRLAVRDGYVRCEVEVTYGRKHHKKGDRVLFDVKEKVVDEWEKS